MSSRGAIPSEVANATGYVKHSLNILWTIRRSSLVTGVFQYQGAVPPEISFGPPVPPLNCSAAYDKCFITFRNKKDALKSFFPFFSFQGMTQQLDPGTTPRNLTQEK